MANKRIKDLTTATTTASGDFIAVDGTSNGTRKLNAAAPAFLTSVTTPSLTSPASTALTLGTGTLGAAITVLAADNNVGIGTITPAAKLDILRTGNTGNQIRTVDSDGITPAIRTYSTADGDGLILNQYFAVAGSPYLRNADFVASMSDISATQMRFFTKNVSTNPAVAMVIDKTGNVGIGVVTPGARLDVRTEYGLDGLRVYDRTGALAVSVNEYGTLVAAHDILNSTGVYGSSANGTALTFLEGASEKMRIDSSGNVGIGTPTPSDNLVVSNAGGVGLEIGVSTGSVINQAYKRSAPAAYVDYQDNCLNRIFWTNGTTEAMRLASTGTVSIASTTAGSAGAGALVVTGGLATGAASYLGGNTSVFGEFRANNIRLENGTFIAFGGSNGEGMTGSQSTNSLTLRTNSTTALTINSSQAATFAGAVTAPAAGYSINASSTYGMSLLQIDNSLDRLGLTAGASVSGATFTARYAAPMVVRMAPDVGVFQICVDSGKTIGNAYTPTGQLEISSTSSTFSGTVIVPAATASLAPLRIPHGTAPTSPTNGDMWTTTAGLYIRINGATVGPLS